MYRNTFGGQLSVLQWVRENGCPWDDYTCSWAANSGHLEVLKWALANGCLWELRSWTTIVKNAVKSKEHMAVLEWLRANGI